MTDTKQESQAEMLPELATDVIARLKELQEGARDCGISTVKIPPDKVAARDYIAYLIPRVNLLLGMAGRTLDAEAKAAELMAENERLKRHIALHAGDCLSLQNEIDGLREPSESEKLK